MSLIEIVDIRIQFTATIALAIPTDDEPSSEMWSGRMPLKTTLEKRRPDPDTMRWFVKRDLLSVFSMTGLLD